MIFTIDHIMQIVCRCLEPHDICALARTDRCMYRAVRALIDPMSVRSVDVVAEQVHATFRRITWTRIDMNVRSAVLFKFKHQDTRMIVPPKSFDYTGSIIMLMRGEMMRTYICMWSTNGYVRSNIYWWGCRFANMSVLKSADRLHFLDYMDQIFEYQRTPNSLLHRDVDATNRTVIALNKRCGCYDLRGDVFISAEFADILQNL